jgi:hypothetical protein
MMEEGRARKRAYRRDRMDIAVIARDRKRRYAVGIRWDELRKSFRSWDERGGRARKRSYRRDRTRSRDFGSGDPEKGEDFVVA